MNLKKKLLSVKEVAEFLGVNPETIRRWDRSGKLKALKINKRGDRRYEQKVIQKFKERVRLTTDDVGEAKARIINIIENLDSTAENVKFLFQVSDPLMEARDLAYFVLNDERTSDFYQRLIDVFRFTIKEDSLKPQATGTDSKGNLYSYPNLKDFTPNQFAYIENSLTKFKHPRIKSRIAHFLWLARKDYKKARIAIDEYIVLAKWTSLRDHQDPKENHGLDILNTIKNAQILSKKIDYKRKAVNELITENILNFNKNSSSKYAVVVGLIRLALNNKKDFNKDFWLSVITTCQTLTQELEEQNNLFFARDFLSLGQRIEKDVLGKQNKKWQQKIAASYEKEATKHKKSFVAVDFILKAMEEYEALGNKSKIEQLQKKLKEAKKNMRFHTFEQSIDLTEWVKKLRTRFRDILAKETPEQFLIRIASDSSIIPKYEEVKKLSERMDDKYPLQSLFPHSIVDQEGNIPRKYEDGAEKKYFSLLRQYSFVLVTYRPLIEVLFQEGMRAGKLGIVPIKKFIRKHLWYGKEYTIRDPDTQKVLKKSCKWIELVEAGLKEYLTEFRNLNEANSKGKDYQPNLVLAIDSLTLKIEGIVREFFETLGKNTDKIRTTRNRLTSEKKDLNELLRDPFAEELFGPSLLLFMKYVFIEHVGFNLRNNISHSFFVKDNYLLFYAHLLLITLLRIGSYQITEGTPLCD